MKYIFLIVLWVLFVPQYLFANSQIDIETSQKDVKVWESFVITISLNDFDSQWNQLQISLPWIEEFNIFSQSSEQRFQSINGETQSVTQYKLSLTPKQPWNYELWPVQIIWEDTMRDNEKINIQVLSDIAVNNLNEDSPDTDILWGELLEELEWWITWIREVKLPLWAHVSIVLFFIIAFYLLLSYVLKDKKKNKQEESHERTESSDTSELHKRYFQSLSSEIGSLSSEEFFHNYNEWMRWIFSDILWKKIKSETLTQLEENIAQIPNTYFTLFQKSYKHEYSVKDVSSQTQKKYIDDILWLLD